MRYKKLLTIMIAGVMMLALAGMAMAQSAASNTGKPADNMTAKKEMPAMKSPEATEKARQEAMLAKDEMMKQSSADDWARIESHYNEMMKMTDAATLKTEIAKHQEMMAAYRAKMMANTEASLRNPSTQGKPMAKGENTKTSGETKPKTISQ